jgi:thymidine phosphorylase
MDKAADIIDSGKPIKKLKAWVAEQNSDPSSATERLEELIAQACG